MPDVAIWPGLVGHYGVITPLDRVLYSAAACPRARDQLAGDPFHHGPSKRHVIDAQGIFGLSLPLLHLNRTFNYYPGLTCFASEDIVCYSLRRPERA